MPKLRLSVKSTNDTNGNRNTNATFDDFLCGRSNLIVFHGGWSTCITMIHFKIDAEKSRLHIQITCTQSDAATCNEIRLSWFS